jgi:hypothetical protein
MGMYADVNSREMKFSGAVARVAHQIGIKCDDGIAVLKRSDVEAIIAVLWAEVNDGTLAKKAEWARESKGGINLQHMYHIASDVNNLSTLLDWFVYTEEQKIVFG